MNASFTGEAARLRAILGLKIAIIEGDVVGGTCVNRSCIPSKSLLVVCGRMRDLQNEHHMKSFGPQTLISEKDSKIAEMETLSLDLKTATIEGEVVGGTCVNRSCVPSKALLAVSVHVQELQNEHLIKSFGLQDMLEEEEKNDNAEFCVKEVQYFKLNYSLCWLLSPNPSYGIRLDMTKILKLESSHDQARRSVIGLKPLADEKREKMKEEMIGEAEPKLLPFSAALGITFGVFSIRGMFC
ncbi:hypothetical protein FXO38_19656 [Capsicum annuum]|nr:hypothetical protein FXO37_29130 [Capsicum annuum]KAF3645395.1 hypothetical protein FXO38_19656 [Capsicum annuum]